MTDLAWFNVDAVPSIHGSIPFSFAVSDALSLRCYDAIAVELPASCADPVLDAVQRWPTISALSGNSGSLIIAPGDSIFEAVHQGIQRDISVYFVDADISCDYGKELLPPLPDTYCITQAGLAYHYNLSETVYKSSVFPEAHTQRNRYMAGRLAELSAKHRRILFVCGASHWHDIVMLLNAPIRGKYGPDAETSWKRLCLPDNRILNNSPWNNEIPFFRYLAFCGVRTVEERMTALFERAARQYRYGISVREIDTMQRYAARLARVEGRITPDALSLLRAASETIGETYAGEVLKSAYSYPSPADPTQLSVCFEASDLQLMTRGPVHEGDAISVEVAMHEFGEQRRRNPLLENQTETVSRPGNWGRYGDEMDREEAFINAVARGFLETTHPDAGECVRFDGDIRDGIDVRETLRAKIGGSHDADIFVRAHTKQSQNDIGAIIFVFDGDEHNYPGSCFTYGRHLGLGFVSEPDRSHPTATVRWGMLTSLLRTYRGRDKRLIVEALYNGEIKYKNYEQCIRATCRLAHKPRVLFVSSRPPNSAAFRQSARQGKTLSFIPISSLPERTIENIRTHNVYFHPET